MWFRAPIPWYRSAFKALLSALMVYFVARLFRRLVSRDHTRGASR